jgi:hypothetical protein
VRVAASGHRERAAEVKAAVHPLATARSKAVSVYIDQSRWVHLLGAREGSPRQRPGAQQALALLETSVAAGKLVAPLSVAHYHETWHRHDWRKRWALAALMRDISAWHTLAPIQTVSRAEIAAAITGGPPPSVIGIGVNHAFDSPTGRFILVEQMSEELYPTPDITEPTPELAGFQQVPALWEWMHLAGPPDDLPLAWLPADMQFQFRPEHARGDEWVENELDVRRRAEEAGMIDRLHDVLIAEDLAALLNDINDVARTHDVDPHPFFEPPLIGPRAFHRSLACRSVLVDLEYFRLSERQYRPQQHDRLDLLAHAVAFAYCDIVVTERRLADLARRARVYERFGTVVLSDLGGLAAVLSEAESGRADGPLSRSIRAEPETRSGDRTSGRSPEPVVRARAGRARGSPADHGASCSPK